MKGRNLPKIDKVDGYTQLEPQVKKGGGDLMKY